MSLLIRALILGLFLAGFPFLASAQSPSWALDASNSSLTFTGTQMGGQFDGKFGDFAAEIRFDPETPELGQVEVTIQTASIDTGGGDRDTTVVSKDFFHVSEFPTAIFKVASFTPGENGAYTATGDLTMKGVTLPVETPVTIDFSGDVGTRTAHARGEITISRLDYKIGEGQWTDTSVVGENVTIRFDIMATETP